MLLLMFRFLLNPIDMARIHTDLHFIPADNIDKALSLLLDAGLVTRSEKDIRFCDLRIVKSKYPDSGAFLEVKCIY